MFVGAGLLGSTVLAAYLEHRFRWDDDVSRHDREEDEPPLRPSRRANHNPANASLNNRLNSRSDLTTTTP
jgi:hypothetical protein